MRPVLAAFLALALIPTRAAAQAVKPADEFAGELRAYARELERLPPASGGERAAYARIDAARPLRIGVFFGFIDTARENYVADPDFKAALIRQLTAACRGSLRACGFAVSAENTAAPNETILLKSQGKRRVIVDVFDSALSDDYRANVARLADRQVTRSRLAEEQYLAALSRDAVVLYDGHTRRFSGAGFFPPLDFTKTSVAALLRRPFFLRVYATLRASAARPPLLGLFACRSREYYAGQLHAAAPDTALIVSSDSSGHENSLLGLFGTLNAVLARPRAADAVRSANANGRPVFHIYGLFGASLHPLYTRFQDGRIVLILLLIIPLLAAFSADRAAEDDVWTPVVPKGAWSGLALSLLLLIPCAIASRTFPGEMVPLPLILSLLGWLGLTLALLAGRRRAGAFARTARWALPPALAFALLYLVSNLLREASPDNALSALRQAGTFALVFALLWPFSLCSEEVLLAPFVGEDGAGFVPACLHALVFFLAVWLALCALAPVYKPRLWPLAALALYGRALSFLLYRRERRTLTPVVAQALTMALIVTEGIHTLIYH